MSKYTLRSYIRQHIKSEEERKTKMKTQTLHYLHDRPPLTRNHSLSLESVKNTGKKILTEEATRVSVLLYTINEKEDKETFVSFPLITLVNYSISS